uniref:Secreted protein n=1 Tax=Globodera pallida TaxID=36090 RepID=A0A183CEK9_GLOPA
MINIDPFYWIKMTFASILILSALTLEAQCQNSISERFNSFILAITSANGDDKQSTVSDQQFVAERPVELELTKARQLQEWIGQVAEKFVDEHDIETANYNCKPNVQIDDVILDDVIRRAQQQSQPTTHSKFFPSERFECSIECL